MAKLAYGVVGLGLVVGSAWLVSVPEARAIPPITKKPVSKEVKLQFSGAAPLTSAQRLSFLRTEAKVVGIQAPTGLLGSTALSARHLQTPGAADLTPHCALMVDPVNNEIEPTPWVKLGAAPGCAGSKKQGLTLRFNVTKANQPVLVEVWVQALAQSILYFESQAHSGITRPLSLAPGNQGHYLSMFVPKQAGWFTAELRLSFGSVKIKGVQVTPAG